MKTSTVPDKIRLDNLGGAPTTQRRINLGSTTARKLGSLPPPQLSDFIKRMDEVEEVELHWLWYPYIIGGNITLLAGEPGVGKGLVAASIASAISRGAPWPGGGGYAPDGRVFWAETEDPADAILKPRLKAAGAKMRRVTTLDLVGAPVPPDLGEIAGMLKKDIEKERLKLIVLSPLKSFLPKLKNANDELAVRKELAKLQALIVGTDCAILGLIHLNKKEDMGVLDRLSGSGAFKEVVRGVLAVGREDEETRRLVNAKHSYGPEGKQLIFTPRHVGKKPEDAYVRADWEAAGDYRDPRMIFQTQNGPDGRSARDWLTAYLGDHGPTEKAKVVEAWEEQGGKMATLETAFSRGKRAGIFVGEVRGFQGPAVWSLLERELARDRAVPGRG